MAKHRRFPGCGRHRRGTPLLVYCRENPQVQERLASARGIRYTAYRMPGRHTVLALTRSGARPRPAFALIASL